MTENVDISEIASISVARDMDITNDDKTYLVLTALEPGNHFIANGILNRATGSSTSLIRVRQHELMLMLVIIIY